MQIKANDCAKQHLSLSSILDFKTVVSMGLGEKEVQQHNKSSSVSFICWCGCLNTPVWFTVKHMAFVFPILLLFIPLFINVQRSHSLSSWAWPSNQRHAFPCSIHVWIVPTEHSIVGQRKSWVWGHYHDARGHTQSAAQFHSRLC